MSKSKLLDLLTEYAVIKEMMSFLKTGGYKGTKIVHDHLKQKGFSISRKKLLSHLHFYAESGGWDSIGGTHQKTWIM